MVAKIDFASHCEQPDRRGRHTLVAVRVVLAAGVGNGSITDPPSAGHCGHAM